MMYRQVLVGVDPTHEDEAAGSIREALRLLDEGGVLHLMTVVHQKGGMPAYPAMPDKDEVEELRKKAERDLDVLTRKHVPTGISVQNHVELGTPGRTIVDSIKDIGVGLVVLVEHGRYWPLARDTVEYVTGHASVPVLVMPTP
jgi:nucleotide-binding universal stress UspA family protein